MGGSRRSNMLVHRGLHQNPASRWVHLNIPNFWYVNDRDSVLFIAFPKPIPLISCNNVFS